MTVGPDPETLEKLVARFRWSAEHECHGYSPLYERFALGTAEDRELLALAAHRRPGQPPANMLFGAVQLLLLRDASHPLAGYYGTLGGRRRDGNPFPLFREFCLARREEIARILETRLVQTNEVGRSAILLPAFALVARRTGRPLALLEIGPSAGLNLRLDSYKYDCGEAGRCGDPRAALELSCRVRGASRPPIPAAVPPIAWRAGLDLDPVDPRDPEATLWLRALVWPEHVERAERLRRALALCEADPPRIVRGDALALLRPLAADAPRDAAFVIFHSHAVNQVHGPDRERLAEVLAGIARDRDLSRVSAEWLGGETPELDLTTWASGRAETALLARYQGHGAWIEWVGPTA
ncbi:MAG: DUF2332 domain-containing protein [Planctomycetales bacterium]|nr:DUF2332 domain-containing protein [Planctomycetales bacterium]